MHKLSLSGRVMESHKNQLFTMAGVFSDFRKEAPMKSFLYNINTIDEDTNMTVQLIHATLGETKHQISQTGGW